MHFIDYYMYQYPILSLAQLGLTIWMAVDAYQRAAEWFWLWIILIFQPIGPWAYFVAVKLADFRGGPSGDSWLAGLLARKTPIDELRYKAEHVPTLANHLALAERLVELRDYTDALPYLDQALAREPDHCRILYLIAVCKVELDKPAEAVPLLEKVIARDRIWSDYSAWRLLVKTRHELDDAPAALATAEELARIAPTMRHHCLLAENLADAGRGDEARKILTRALDEHRYAPPAAKRLSRKWAGEAKKILRQLPVAKVS